MENYDIGGDKKRCQAALNFRELPGERRDELRLTRELPAAYRELPGEMKDFKAQSFCLKEKGKTRVMCQAKFGKV